MTCLYQYHQGLNVNQQQVGQTQLCKSSFSEQRQGRRFPISIFLSPCSVKVVFQRDTYRTIIRNVFTVENMVPGCTDTSVLAPHHGRIVDQYSIIIERRRNG